MPFDKLKALSGALHTALKGEFAAVEWVKVESKVDEGGDVIVRRAAVKWEGFQPFMDLWTKLYGRV